MKDYTTMVTDTWITINDAPKHENVQRTEKEERERLKYWSNFWSKRNKVKASSCTW